jgi:hypothetical protein
MAEDAAFTPEEIAALRKLLEVEKIRKVKTLYSQLMDARDWQVLSLIFAEDVVAELGAYGNLVGRAAVTAAISGEGPDEEGVLPSLMRGRAPYDGLHNTTNMWIELTGPDRAIARTYLHDVLFESHPRINPVFMFGIYDEDYVKRDGAWQIARFRVQFLWPERAVADDFPRRMVPTSLG